jgi:hypothetical protein
MAKSGKTVATTARREAAAGLSIIVPLFNEARGLEAIHQRIVAAARHRRDIPLKPRQAGRRITSRRRRPLHVRSRTQGAEPDQVFFELLVRCGFGFRPCGPQRT